MLFALYCPLSIYNIILLADKGSTIVLDRASLPCWRMLSNFVTHWPYLMYSNRVSETSSTLLAPPKSPIPFFTFFPKFTNLTITVLHTLCVSAYFGFHLQLLPSYIKDTYNFLEIIPSFPMPLPPWHLIIKLLISLPCIPTSLMSVVSQGFWSSYPNTFRTYIPLLSYPLPTSFLKIITSHFLLSS